MEREISTLAAWLGAARRAVIFTGAGISTASGIPDFRGPQGLWRRIAPVTFVEYRASAAARRRAFALHAQLAPLWAEARPNRGHRAVAALVAAGKGHLVVTQNVDRLHQAAGVPEERVVELHGNFERARCLDCGVRTPFAALLERFRQSGEVPACGACGGVMKVDAISFGEPLPADAFARAREASLAADLFLVLGSSLSVYPAAELPLWAARAGARLAIVNREPTPLDEIAQLVLRGDVGEVLGDAVGVA